jgi:hypothetical protein
MHTQVPTRCSSVYSRNAQSTTSADPDKPSPRANTLRRPSFARLICTRIRFIGVGVQMRGATVTSSQPPPGWYPNPSGEPGQRYWDGVDWTIVNVPAVPTYHPHARPSANPNTRGNLGQQPSTDVGAQGMSPAQSGSPTIKVVAIIGGVIAALLALPAGCTAFFAALGSSTSVSRTAACSNRKVRQPKHVPRGRNMLRGNERRDEAPTSVRDYECDDHHV